MNWEDYRAKLIIAVMGEAESCSFFEKYLIACVGWNRWFHQKKYRFNPLEKDFLGYRREIIINDVSREKMEESIKAVDRAFIELNAGNKKYNDLFFFNLSGKKPSTIFKVEPVIFDKIVHTFFRIID
ncbi:hypothetical protein [Marinitoga sp. 1155]|uniref:hypothetical protein n=1 Tax=Marinitoga sp. 1155 TaxID=1428448 RepID=UPI0006413D53|nr:hypothetical protein [Marinitoga sp. 1155]AJW77009.1 hypothetical protein UF09_43 [Marinitoga camini virus 2]KLO24827.1 hypothetical protein X274_02485 [Marinitoga sp. 1155]